jgi:hypothetical protein
LYALTLKLEKISYAEATCNKKSCSYLVSQREIERVLKKGGRDLFL